MECWGCGCWDCGFGTVGEKQSGLPAAAASFDSGHVYSEIREVKRKGLDDLEDINGRRI